MVLKLGCSSLLARLGVNRDVMGIWNFEGLRNEEPGLWYDTVRFLAEEKRQYSVVIDKRSLTVRMVAMHMTQMSRTHEYCQICARDIKAVIPYHPL
jgi:hypothetical protein